MKIPLKAPSLRELFLELEDIKKIPEIISDSSVNIPKKYLHWDQLRHREPPKGISHREWWLAIKLLRRGVNNITLVDKHGEPFNYNTVEPISERLHGIDLNAGGRILMEENQINPDTRDQYVVRSLIQEAITSSQLEGASTTRVVAKELIRTGRKPKDRSEKMILNNYITMRKIRKLRDEPLTGELVFAIHRSITMGALDDSSAAGRFREESDDIEVSDPRDNTTLHIPPPASELPDRMKKMCEFANGKDNLGFIHPVIRSIILHFWLAYDHPFCDGNGRTARALFYWSMLRNEYWLFEFISISEIIFKAPAKYARAFLFTETDSNDLTYFILYHIELINRAIEVLHDYVDKMAKKLERLKLSLKSSVLINYRQRALIIHALNHHGNIYTINGHRTSHDVTYETARKDLTNLEEIGLFASEKYKKKWHFQAVDKIEEKLANLH